MGPQLQAATALLQVLSQLAVPLVRISGVALETGLCYHNARVVMNKQG
jgi:hypothetical protein